MAPWRVIDLFAGIGGFHYAFERAGARIVFASEIDGFARAAYEANHKEGSPELFEGGHFAGDIRQVTSDEVPAFDIIAGGFPCFTEEALVLTKRGHVSIKDVQIGDLVLTHRGRWRPVTALMSKHAPATRTIKITGSATIQCTENHRFWSRARSGSKQSQRRVLTEAGWVHAKDIADGESFALAQLPPEEFPRGKDASETEMLHSEDFWWVVGRWLADGWRAKPNGKGRAVICCAHHEADELEERIRRVVPACRSTERTATKFHITRYWWYDFLEQFGTGASNKLLPGWVLALPQGLAKALADGYYSGDSHRSANPRGSGMVSKATTVSPALAHSMILLNWKAYGVYGSITEVAVAPTKLIEGRTVNQKPWFAVARPDRNKIAFVHEREAWTLVRKNDEAEAAMVYNLSVEGDESYTVNNVAVSNCQAFSAAGVSKNNSLGRVHGFSDETRGTLFFEIARLIRDRQPAAFLLENVKNLLAHDKGRTFEVIRHTLVEELGYQLDWRVISSETLVPQRRERVFLVGFREPTDWQWPEWADQHPRLGDILEIDVDAKYTLTDRAWQSHQSRRERNRAAGKGFGYSMFGPSDITRTISARYGKDGSEALVEQPGMNPRRLTPREALRLQGFPDSHQITGSNFQAYKQAGNAVAVPVVERLAKQVVAALDGAAWAHPSS